MHARLLNQKKFNVRLSVVYKNRNVSTVYILLRYAMHKRGLPMPSCAVRPSVRPSVTFVYYVDKNKHIFNMF